MLDKRKETPWFSSGHGFDFGNGPYEQELHICTCVDQHCFSKSERFNYFFPSKDLSIYMQINHIYIGNLDFYIFYYFVLVVWFMTIFL